MFNGSYDGTGMRAAEQRRERMCDVRTEKTTLRTKRRDVRDKRNKKHTDWKTELSTRMTCVSDGDLDWIFPSLISVSSPQSHRPRPGAAASPWCAPSITQCAIIALWYQCHSTSEMPINFTNWIWFARPKNPPVTCSVPNILTLPRSPKLLTVLSLISDLSRSSTELPHLALFNFSFLHRLPVILSVIPTIMSVIPLIHQTLQLLHVL